MKKEQDRKQKAEKEKSLMISKRDKEIFFRALLGNEEGPNQALISAIQLHNRIVALDPMES